MDHLVVSQLVNSQLLLGYTCVYSHILPLLPWKLPVSFLLEFKKKKQKLLSQDIRDEDEKHGQKQASGSFHRHRMEEALFKLFYLTFETVKRSELLRCDDLADMTVQGHI